MGILSYGSVILNNVTCNYEDGEELVEGKNIILSADYGYKFEEGFYDEDGFTDYHYILKNNYPVSMTFNEKYLTTTVNNWVIEDGDNFTLTGDYETIINPSEQSPKYVVNYGTSQLINCSCNYEDGEELKEEKLFQIIADEGYLFEEGEYGEDGYEYYNKIIVGSSVENLDFTPKILSYKQNEYFPKDFTLTGVYSPIKSGVIETVGTFVNLYNTNNEELTEISKIRFVTGVDDVIDYGQFINSLYILPFKIPSELLEETKQNVLLGNINSGVKSTIINNYLLEIEGGTIEVPSKYHNIYDFVNTECILHIPFLDKIYLNNEYVIGQSLTIEMYVDLYSSNLTVNIISSFNNEIIASAKSNVGMNIPFIQRSNNNVTNSLSNIYKNNINRCFIEVNRNIPYTKNNNVFGGSTIEYGTIGNYEGYLKCDNVVLETSATNIEKEEIKQLLLGGIMI